MTTQLYFDGLCEPGNPGGIACYGWLIRSSGAIVASGRGEAARGPAATNNVAEWAALIAGLEAARAAGIVGRLEVHGDSQLVCNQVTGRWRVNAANLRPLFNKARSLIAALAAAGCQVRVQWIPRAKNAEADALSRQAYAESSRSDL